MTILQAWPLGDASDATETAPHGRGQCMQRVVLLGDWHDAGRGTQLHQAQDIFAPRGTPVLSPVAGRVASSGMTESGGYSVRLTNRQGSIQLSHFDAPPLVQVGDTVTVGQQLGVVGNTGRRASRTCPHLHIGARTPSGQAINLYSELRALAPASRVRPSRDRGVPTLDQAVSRGASTGAAVAFALALVAIAASKRQTNTRYA